MNRESIKSSVKKEVENWRKDSIQNYPLISLSSKAIDFITDLISNISEDPSPNWKRNPITLPDYDQYQREAIATIPKALNSLINKLPFNSKNATISVWEIWQSLPKILRDFCFIPEKDM